MTNINTKVLMLASVALIGSAGIAHADADYRNALHDTAGHVIRNTDHNCVRTWWQADHDICARSEVITQTPPQRIVQAIVPPRQEMRTSIQLTQEDRTVYFAFNRAALSPEAKLRLDTLAQVLKSNQSINEARVVGYADRIGSPSYNERLSQKRAETVSDYLIANGYSNARVTQTRWVGETRPSTNCPSSGARQRLIQCLHNDRRVEVEIGYASQWRTPVTDRR